MMISGKKSQAENGHVAQAMDGDGDHQIFFFFIGCCKHNSANDLGQRQVVSVVMWQYKKSGGDQDRCKKSPLPEKPEDDSSEK